VVRGRHKVYDEFVAHVINTASSQDVLGNHFNGHHSSLDSFLLKKLPAIVSQTSWELALPLKNSKF